MWSPVKVKKTSSREGCRTSICPPSLPHHRGLAPVPWSVPETCRPPRSAAVHRQSRGPGRPPGQRGPGRPRLGVGQRHLDVRAPARLLNSSGVPSAMTRPWLTTTIRSARSSASSRYWVVRSTVTPARSAPGWPPTPAGGWWGPARSWARPGTAPEVASSSWQPGPGGGACHPSTP